MHALDDLWTDLIALRDTFQHDKFVAAPFVTAERASFSHQPIRLMLIGKATRGDWYEESYIEASSRSSDSQLSERKRVFREFVEQEAQKPSGRFPTFWNFAREVSERVGNGGQPLANLAWSNVCKLGSKQGNPEGFLYTEQADLCERILRAEIASLDPHILLCVNANFGKDILLKSLRATDERLWIKSEEIPRSEVDNVWRFQTAEGRHVLWSRHPQGMSATCRTYIMQQVCDIAGKPD